jgi:adenylate cyclase
MVYSVLSGKSKSLVMAIVTLIRSFLFSVTFQVLIFERRTVMRLRNWIFTALMIALLGHWALQGSPLWGGSVTEAPASIENMAHTLPAKPSFVVLPFNETSKDSEPKYLCDGFTNTLFEALFDIPTVFVIHRRSASKYKGKPVTAKQAAEELGVQYVVKGDFQKSGDQLQIAVQMIDALKGEPAWSQSYDLNIKDTLKIQNDITLNILKSAGMKYDKILDENRTVEGTNNIDAYLTYLNATHNYLKSSPEGHRKARELCEQAIALDPNYFKPYSILAVTCVEEARWGFSKSPEKSLDRALNVAQAAVELDKSYSMAHAVMGRVLYNLKEHDKAIAEFEQAISLNPENTLAYYFLGWTLMYAGRAQEAIPAFSKMMRSNPLNPQSALLGLGGANLFAGNYEKAIPYYQKMIEEGSKFYRAYLDLGACYAALGRQEEAEVNCKEVLKLNPKFTMTKHIARLPAKNPEAIKLYTEALTKLEMPK